MRHIIKADRSIIIACDVDLEDDLVRLVRETTDIAGIGGYKIGSQLGILYGVRHVVEIIRRVSDLPLIYDHQKGGTDIPELGSGFAKACQSAGVDAVILFPFGGKATETTWIQACQDRGLGVIVGGHMTQPAFLYSQEGFIADEAPAKIYRIAAENGVRDFVVPGNKVEEVRRYRTLLDDFCTDFALYAPGFITQGGDISECGRLAGSRWHAIVGSAIYRSKNIRAAATRLTQQIKSQE